MESSGKRADDTKKGLQDTSIGAAETQNPDAKQEKSMKEGAESAAARGGPVSSDKKPKSADLVEAANSN